MSLHLVQEYLQLLSMFSPEDGLDMLCRASSPRSSLRLASATRIRSNINLERQSMATSIGAHQTRVCSIQNKDMVAVALSEGYVNIESQMVSNMLSSSDQH